MLCTIAGDSLAVGVGTFTPQCEVLARVGIGSSEYLRVYAQPISSDRVVISLGANDDPNASTRENLSVLRSRITARQVFWLLPGRSERAREAIYSVARSHGDHLIDTEPAVGLDRLHLSGQAYQAVAQLTMSVSW